MTARQGLILCLLFVLSAVDWGCATAPQFIPPGSSEPDPRVVLNRLCAPGGAPTVTGGAWIKAESAEATGQFPAEIKVEAFKVTLEVTNLVGGQEALIRVEGNRIEIQRPGKPTEFARDHWAGIPLKWSQDLLRGRTPCPPGYKSASAQWMDAEKGVLLVTEAPKTRYLYGLTRAGGHIVVRVLDIEGGSAPTHFEFFEHRAEDGTYEKFEAASALGKVRLKWKSRTVKSESSAS